jgi:hypothetical protein
MDFKFSIRPNEKLYLRDPQTSELGQSILNKGIEMLHKLGFEAFTFKKLSEEIKTTEASIYRYFENKHRLLLYILTWYWNYLEYQVVFSINNMTDPEEKIKKVIDLLTHELVDNIAVVDFNKKALYEIVINESNKVYLSKYVDEDNKAQLFKSYKDLCARIASLISEYNSAYPFPHSLSSTLIETAHLQQFFTEHLPRLTDVHVKKDYSVKDFLENLVFSALKK